MDILGKPKNALEEIDVRIGELEDRIATWHERAIQDAQGVLDGVIADRDREVARLATWHEVKQKLLK